MNTRVNSSFAEACKKRNFPDKLLLITYLFTLFFLSHTSHAATISSANAGNWNSPSTWVGGVVPAAADDVTISHALVLNVPITVTGTYTFNTNSSGAGNLTLSGGTLNINANVSFNGNGNVFNGGIVNIQSNRTLSMGSAVNQTGTTINIASNAIFKINGNYTNNGGSIAVDGKLDISGNYIGQNGAAVTGNGTFVASGNITSGMGTNTVFSVTNPSCTTGNCNGNALCGTTATSAASPSSVCAGAPFTLTGALVSGTPASYQWESSTTLNGAFSAITSATSNTYSSSLPAGTYYYRVAIVASGSSCITKSNTTTVIVNALPASSPSASGGIRDCNTGRAALSASGTPSTYVWYTTSSGGTSIGTSSGSGSFFYTPLITETTTYYVAYKNGNNCESAARTAVVATVNPCTLSWTGAMDTNWENGDNWSGFFVPGANDDITIPSSASNMPALINAAHIGAITIDAGSYLTLSFDPLAPLHVYGDITNSGDIFYNEDSKLSLRGTSAQTINGVASLNHLEINNTAGVSLLSSLALNGNLSLTKGILHTNNYLSIIIQTGGNIAYASSDLGSIDGKVTILRDIPSSNTHYFSVPVENVKATDLTDDVQVINPSNGSTRLFTNDFENQNWNAITDMNTVFNPMQGYSLFFPAAASVDFTGDYTHGKTFSTGNHLYHSSGQFVMVGNPYPSALDWDNAAGWTKTNVYGAIYFWNPVTKSFASYVAGSGTNGGTKYVPVMNSFYVEASGSSGTASVAVNNAARSTVYAAYWRTTKDAALDIILSNKTNSDETVVRFNEGATNEFDGNLDAKKFSNLSSVPSIYTYLGNVKYSVNSVAEPDDFPVIPLYMIIPSAGEYVLKVKNSTGKVYMIEDTKLGTTVLMGDSIVFEGSKFDATDRFVLKLQGLTTFVGKPTNSALKVQSSPGGFLLETKDLAGKQANIEILDITGRSLKALPALILENGYKMYALNEFVPGTYLIKVLVEDTAFIGQITLIK